MSHDVLAVPSVQRPAQPEPSLSLCLARKPAQRLD
ncbi:Uncharacterised protein [Burkholderia cenocepacia]|nr:Uncharacterised protein [Burkholderia cenocepacia]SPV08981.1 Uncharacterised protein [Burkholderia cenocepacia]